MKLRPYPKYKDSGIERLGEIPEEWKIKRLKYIAHIEMGQSPDSSFYNRDGIGVPFLQGNADFKGLYPQPQVWTPDGNKYSQKNDILISVRAPVGEINISNDHYAIGRGLAALRFNKKSNFMYYYYLILKSKNYLDSVSTGTTYSAISTNDIKNIIIAVPPIDQQTKIANYLDQKTSKIDELTKKNERLIELLREKRQAIISQAVTKGLDPNVKMKNSGIEWLGKIPEGWNKIPIKFLVKAKRFAIKTGPFGSDLKREAFINQGIKIYNQQNVINKDFNLGENYISKTKYETLMTFTTYPGDLLITTRGTIGRCAILPEGYPKGILHPCLIRVQIDETKCHKEFLTYIIQDSNYFYDQLLALSNATTIDVIYGDNLSNTFVMLPPLNEQICITNFLDQKTSKIDELIKKIQSQIEKFKEYRQTLISNVVTGKVRISDTA